ncbi:MAG: Verru_Chthon cassette protein A [Candidatus Methylacidiphilales bacterium]
MPSFATLRHLTSSPFLDDIPMIRSLSPSAARRRRRTRGVALVIVLAVLVLVLGFCVAFLSRVSTERTSSDRYASTIHARLLADTAVQVVQGQIDAATQRGSTPLGPRTTWSSQPGLIRTFDDTGAPTKSYKLYSSASMQMAGALVPSDETATLSAWYENPAIYTDLNAPVDARFSGTADTWPILNPSSFTSSGSAPPTPLGFEIDSAAPRGTFQGVTNPAPMPVMWLYVLKDGSVIAPSGSGSDASVAGATVVNPIVGRIAFWTDDETCKVNVNTASEGTYWDVPRVNTVQDVALGTYQPAQNEFQAFPGHPATTSLSAVLTDTTAFTPVQIFALAPRVQEGGSLGGTAISSTAVALDRDRLYATADELVFSTAYSGSSGNSGTRSANSGMSGDLLDRNRFFLTTTSRAPEVNLFGLPKVACWPISFTDADTHRTAFDRLIAACATLNGQPYYFQRQNSHSMTDDYNLIARNKILYPYLQTLMARDVPGFGGRLSTKFGADADQILTEIFDYIRCTNLWDGNLAVNTGQFTEGKQGAATSTNHLPGHGQVVPIAIGSTQGFGRFTTVSEVGMQFICTADGTDMLGTKSGGVPSNSTTNLTLPTSPTPPLQPGVSPVPPGVTTKQIRVEAALLLEHFCAMHGFESMRPDFAIKIEGLEALTLKGNADAATVPLGFPSLSRQTSTDAGVYMLRDSAANVPGHLAWGGTIGVIYPLYMHGMRARGRMPQDAAFTQSSRSDGVLDRQYPFVSEPVTITVNIANPQMTLNGAPITIRIVDRVTGATVQTLNLNFPGGTWPAPVLMIANLAADKTTTKAAQQWWTFQAGGNGQSSAGRFASGAGLPMANYATIMKDYDVVRTAVPVDSTGGQTWDYRLLAAGSTVDATHFAGHPSNGTTTLAVSAFAAPISGHAPANGIAQGKLSANVTYGKLRGPDLPFPLSADAMKTGDWDNGLSYQIDGPYLNKPDEGNAPTAATTNGSVPYFGNLNPGTGVFAAVFTSPNRTMPSPGMFGSLPTGVKRDRGWETLLFRRQPTHPGYVDSGSPGTTKGAGGFSNAPDYLMLDLFWMPVVEPYAISEPLSTAGKINMNQQIIPFTYIKRDTGLYAVMKNEKVMAILSTDAGNPTGNSDGTGYKDTSQVNNKPTQSPSQYRRAINIPATLQQFQFRFDNADGTGLYAFRSPAEICDMHLIPDNATISTAGKQAMDNDMAAFWTLNGLTGDNTRERPYTTIYPRLTTRSNTYTVHFHAQTLKKVAGSDPSVWHEGRDVISANYRGSETIERYIDPNAANLPDFAANPDAAPALDSFYHWRTRSYHQFSP